MDGWKYVLDSTLFRLSKNDDVMCEIYIESTALFFSCSSSNMRVDAKLGNLTAAANNILQSPPSFFLKGSHEFGWSFGKHAFPSTSICGR